MKFRGEANVYEVSWGDFSPVITKYMELLLVKIPQSCSESKLR